MSDFSVEIFPIEEIIPIANADRIELARIGGFRSVVKKGEFKEGQAVFYIPEGALVPENILDAIGLKGALSGAGRNRVKPIRLRGELSEGIVVSPDIMADLLDLEKYKDIYPANVKETGFVFRSDENYAEVFEIIKWEPTLPLHLRGRAVQRPSWFPRYTDINNVKSPKYKHFFVPGELVIMTEKIHGTNFGVGFHKEHGLIVSSRNLCLEEDESNLYWRATRKWGLEEVVRSLCDEFDADHVILWGEIFGPGVQHLHYGGEEVNYRAFDLAINGTFVNYSVFENIVEVPKAPVLFSGPFSQERVIQFTSGLDTISASHIREGVVIRPIDERIDERGRRVILKSINPDYKGTPDETEYH